MKWKYSLPTDTVCTSFDCGEVEADTREEAFEKAKAELQYTLDKVNEVINSSDNTMGNRIDMDFYQLEIEEIVEAEVKKSIIVVYTIQRFEDDRGEVTKHKDHWRVFRAEEDDFEKQARKFYKKVLKKKNLFSASITEVLESTDY